MWSDLKHLRAHEHGELSDPCVRTRIRDVVSTFFVSFNRVVRCTIDYTGHALHAQCLLLVILFVHPDHAFVAWLNPSCRRTGLPTLQHCLSHETCRSHRTQSSTRSSEFSRTLRNRTSTVSDIAGRDIHFQFRNIFLFFIFFHYFRCHALRVAATSLSAIWLVLKVQVKIVNVAQWAGSCQQRGASSPTLCGRQQNSREWQDTLEDGNNACSVLVGVSTEKSVESGAGQYVCVKKGSLEAGLSHGFPSAEESDYFWCVTVRFRKDLARCPQTGCSILGGVLNIGSIHH